MSNAMTLKSFPLARILLASLLAGMSAGWALAQDKMDEDFPFQGEYVGELGQGSEKVKFGLQVIAVGQGQFRAVGYHGGLPGEGWDHEPPLRVKEVGKRNGDTVTFVGETGTGTLRYGTMTVDDPQGYRLGELQKLERRSPTLGKAAPEGAVVLFDGQNVEAWDGGQLSDDGLLMPGATTRQKFGSHKLHIEFRLPYQPEASGQGRGNSGLYVQGRYEVQMLDSFGLEGLNNECGGIYSIKAPDLNMCYPPMTWQTYDVEFTAATYQEGKVVAPPRITVYHNGTKIHDNVALPSDQTTGGAVVDVGPEPGPIYLQDHGNPVRYRNIWVLEKK